MDSQTQNNKRLRNDYSDSDTDTGTSTSQQFPRFLIIESIEEDKQIAKLSPFVIEKQIESIAGIPKSVKKLKSGNLLIEIDRPQYAKNLLKTTVFFHIKCKCYPHQSLNTSKGVIRCPDLAGVSDAEITEELKAQNVTNARRIKVKRDNKLHDTHTIVLTFGTAILPRTIRIGYLITKVDVYIPSPLQCYDCFKFGHGTKSCRASDICGNCGGDGYKHNEQDCKYPTKCVNCNEEHNARSKDCPIWKLEKEVLQVKYTQNIAFPEARKIVRARHSPPTSSYSSITKSGTRSVKCVDVQTQTEKERSEDSASNNKPVNNDKSAH